MDNNELPVWLYWEGDLPEWIGKCQQSVFMHAKNVQLINGDDFNKLRDIDLDINVDDLQVAHRADFIRAFLLYRFGGLWIDSDCIVMKSLDAITDLLKDREFLGYRERSGEVTNNFMGAALNSIIAASYYDNVCKILRSGEPIEWLTLGSKALTNTLDASNTAWQELDVDQIQPICWSNPDAFFKIKTSPEHELIFNPTSYCYMASANMIRGFYNENGKPNILADDTFFSFLLVRSLKNIKLEMILA